MIVFERPNALTDRDTHYCPGCTHGLIHRLVAEVIDELEIEGRTIGVAPVGCAVMAYDYFACDMVEAAHGRAPAVATGIKRANADNVVFTYQGDGDLASIGTAETVHAAAQGASLYIRPFILGTDETLGVHAAERALLGVILSPVGSYYREGLRPVGILIEEKDVRAVRGGTGYAKCGGNYAASIRAGAVAAEKGYSQVLWLDGVERRYVEEVGAMNVMFKISGRIVTPALTDSILPGITRKSCIELLRSQGREVDERPLPVDELIDALEGGALEETWGCGTAAVISPIGRLAYGQQEYEINGGRIGPVTQSLYDTLTGIQRGLLEDPFDWIVPVD